MKIWKGFAAMALLANVANAGEYEFNILIHNVASPDMRIDLYNGGDWHWIAQLAPAGNYSGQMWHFEPATSDGFWLSSAFSGAENCLSVVEDLKWEGHHVVKMLPCGQAAHQTWEFSIDANGDVKLVSPDFGGNQCLTPTAPSNPLVVVSCGTLPAQEWHFDIHR